MPPRRSAVPATAAEPEDVTDASSEADSATDSGADAASEEAPESEEGPRDAAGRLHGRGTQVGPCWLGADRYFGTDRSARWVPRASAGPTARCSADASCTA